VRQAWEREVLELLICTIIDQTIPKSRTIYVIYGKEYDVREEMLTITYQYKVSSGIKLVVLDFKQFVLCYMDIAAN